MFTQKHLFSCWGKVLFSIIVKPGMFGLGMASKENFLTYSSWFIFLIMKLVPRNLIMAIIDMCDKVPILGEWIYENTWKHVLPLIFFIYLLICLSVKYFYSSIYASFQNFKIDFSVLKIIGMFKPVNMRKFSKKYWKILIKKTIVNSIWKQPFRAFPHNRCSY